MLREVSRGAWSFCILLPQYRGRDVSQTRNTHGLSKALQYLKTHPRRPGSQDSGKVFACRAFASPDARQPHRLPSHTKRPEGRDARGRPARSSFRSSAGEELLSKGGQRDGQAAPRDGPKRNPRDELKALGARAAEGREADSLPGLSGIARLGDVRRASAVFVGRTGSHFWTARSKTAARYPNLKTPIWLIPARDPLCHYEFCRCSARARDAIAGSIAAGVKGAEGNGH